MSLSNKETIFHAKRNLVSNILSNIKELFDIALLENQIKTFSTKRGVDNALSVDINSLLATFKKIHAKLPCAHNPSHALEFIYEMLKQEANIQKFPEACFVEAGCFKGGSSAKFSLVASCLARDFFIFDSFEGLPANDEQHDTSVEGYSIKDWFKEGHFTGTLEEVKSNITSYGEIATCHFVKGWFNETMPKFDRQIIAAFIDVDLASSTETCLRNLYPLLVPGGVIVSQDGDFPLVVEVIKNDALWRGIEKRPKIVGLNKKITKIYKPAD